MTSDPFPGLREYLAVRFGSAAREAAIEPLAGKAAGIKEGGYGVPYRVEWRTDGGGTRTLVLETVRPGPFGHEDRSDRAGILLRAYDEYGSLPRHVGTVDVGAFHSGAPAVSLGGTGEFFILTDFIEGEPYAADFETIAERGRLEEIDGKRAAALADYLAELHRPPVSHPSWYRRRIRELTGSGECLAGVADSYPLPFGFVDASLLETVERLALKWRYRLRGRDERLRTVHGDFHPWNILFRSGADFTVLDRSRGPYGDPADDVASLGLNYVFYALRTRGDFGGSFAELFRVFWDRYVGRSGDADLGNVIAPHFAFRALVLANPLWYPRESESVRRLLFRFLLSVLEADAFDPGRVPEYLARPSP